MTTKIPPVPGARDPEIEALQILIAALAPDVYAIAASKSPPKYRHLQPTPQGV
jgi:hypothetical protein